MQLLKVPKLIKPIYNTRLKVRISDINYGQHLGHDALISLLHEARLRFLNQLHYSESDVEGLSILVTSLHVNYLNEAFYGDELQIEIGVHQIIRASIDLIYRVYKQPSVNIARAMTTITLFDKEKGRVAKIPAPFLKRLAVMK